MGRRGENVFKRKDGRWEARYIKGRSLEGKTLYGFVYAKSYKEVKNKRDLKLKEIDYPVISEISKNYEELLKQWLILIKPTVKESTYHCYKRHINNHIIPKLGFYDTNEINRLKIMEFVQNKLSNGRLDEKGGLSPKTVIELLNIIKLSFQFASSIGFSEGIDLKIKIQRKKKKIKILSSEEQKLILDAIKENPDSLGVSIILALYCGLRIGEICALITDDIDLQRREINVNKTLYRIQDDSGYSKTKIVISETKTEKGRRVVPIPKSIISYLKRYARKESGYFIAYEDKAFEPRKLSFQFNSLLKKIGLRSINFHTLRHTFASRCIELGFDYNILSEILGHSKASTTMNLYVHTNNTNKQKYMDRLDLISSQ